jgi:hypothetical protein
LDTNNIAEKKYFSSGNTFYFSTAESGCNVEAMNCRAFEFGLFCGRQIYFIGENAGNDFRFACGVENV